MSLFSLWLFAPIQRISRATSPWNSTRPFSRLKVLDTKNSANRRNRFFRS